MSLILEDTQKKCFRRVKLNGTTVVVQTYTTEAMGVLGVMMVKVQYGEYVTLMSCMWLKAVDLVCCGVPGWRS